MPTSLAAALPDSALCDLLTRKVTRREAAEELMRGHGRTTLAAYTRFLCGNRQDAHVLMVETFHRTLDVFCDQNPPRTTWITCLPHEARRLAAQWADSGRHAALSPHFLHWLRQRGGDTPAGCARALCGAEAWPPTSAGGPQRLRDDAPAAGRGVHLRLLREAPEERVWPVTDELFYLFREGEMVARLRTFSREDEVHDRPLHPDDLDTVLRMAEQTEGPASAELVRYWARRQPQAFSVYRLVSTGRTVAFTARLALPAPADPEDLAADPVVAAAWEYAEAAGPVRPGEHIGVSRFSVYPERYQVPSRVIDLSSSRAQAESARARGRAYGFAVWRDTETWSARVKGSLADTGARPRVGEHTYGLFAVDWRQVPVETWLRHFIAATAVPTRAGPSGVSRAAFDQAVRDALTHWRDAGAFAACALLRTRLAADFGEPVEELRALLRGSVDDLARDPRGVRARDAVTAGYFSGAPTQEAAARRLGLPYGTYRRHLRQGLDLLSEALWRLELHGPGPG